MTRRQESSTTLSTSALFSLLIFLSTCEVEARFSPHVCYPSSCGDIDYIDYPFRLDTDPAACGERAFQFSCENNKTILEFHSGKYYVKEIYYADQRIRVVDVNLADGSCKLPYKSVSIQEVMDDQHYRLVSTTYTSFFRCSSNLSYQGYRLVPCLSGNGAFVYVSYDNYVIPDLQGPCSFISRVPTIYQAVFFPSYENILKLMQSGFDLEWSVKCWDSSFSYDCYKSDNYIGPWLDFFFTIWNFLSDFYLISRSIIAPLIICGFLIHKYISTRKEMDKDKFLINQQHLMPRRYSYSDLIAITYNFKDKLGQGGFGAVYKGQHPDGYFVAVKMLVDAKCNDEDFVNEVSIMSRIYHVNIVKLVGFCSEGSYRALIFEYMVNGSLDKYIFSREAEDHPLSWEKLLQIALGIARGIEHLHVGFDVCILHSDIKPHNVLLDHDFIPKVSDFGLAKFYPKEHDFVSISTTRGTIGYIAPEMISRDLGAVSCKSDVYSFGMLLLEMVGRRRNVDDAKGNCSSEAYFPSWVYDHLSEGGDLQLENVTEIEAATARKLCMVGLWCVQKTASDRPSMTKVVEMLEGNVNDLQLPPNALSFPQSVSKEPQSDSSTELLISETMEPSAIPEK